MVFPRPNGRGLIEAQQLAGARVEAPIEFPRPNGRGLIEAIAARAASLALAAPFPRPNGRGLIEAAKCVTMLSDRGSFRGPTAAASLKQADPPANSEPAATVSAAQRPRPH